jgi:hypothetical protein
MRILKKGPRHGVPPFTQPYHDPPISASHVNNRLADRDITPLILATRRPDHSNISPTANRRPLT